MNGKTAAYAVNVMPLLQNEDWFEKALATVTEKRREKAVRYRKKEDTARSLGAELLLRYAFFRAGEPFPKQLALSANGKPFDPDGPLRFNLSHSGKWVMCIVSDDEVGCDVERIDPAHVDVAFSVFTEKEQAALTAVNERERTHRFFRLWTLKESYQKASGKGMALPLSSFSVELGNPSRIIADSNPTFTEYDDISGYACSVCRLSGGKTPPLTVVSMRELLENEVKE